MTGIDPINEKIFFVSGQNEPGDFVDCGGYVVNGIRKGGKKGETEKTFALELKDPLKSGLFKEGSKKRFLPILSRF